MRVRFPLPAHVETYSKLISFKMHSKLGVVGSSPTRSTYLWLAVTFSIDTAVFRIAIYITELHSLGGSSVGRALKNKQQTFPFFLRLVAHSEERSSTRWKALGSIPSNRSTDTLRKLAWRQQSSKEWAESSLWALSNQESESSLGDIDCEG